MNHQLSNQPLSGASGALCITNRTLFVDHTTEPVLGIKIKIKIISQAVDDRTQLSAVPAACVPAAAA